MKPETSIEKIIEEIIESGLIADKYIEEARLFLKMKFGMAIGVGFNYGMSYNTLKRSIIQYDKEGKYIKLFESITDASRITGIGLTSIQKALSKKHSQKTAGDFYWEYNSLE